MRRFIFLLLLVASPAWGDSALYKDLVLADGPAVYLRFEESSGTAAANSADWGAHSWVTSGGFTYSGSPTFSAVSPFADGSRAIGLGGSACAFSAGSSGDDQATDAVQKSWTIEMWLRRTALSAGVVYDKVNVGQVEFDGSNNLLFTPDSSFGCAIETISIPIGNLSWHHVALVSDYAAQTYTMYLDGAQVSQKTSCQFAATPTNTTHAIGTAGADSCSSAASIQIDEFATYFAPLSAARIAEHYAAARPCVKSASGWSGACPATARAVVATGSSGTVGGIVGEVTHTVDFGTSYAYDGTTCTAPTLQQVASGAKQWVGYCSATSGTMDLVLRLPASFVAHSGMRAALWGNNANASPSTHTFSVRCACTAPGGAEITDWTNGFVTQAGRLLSATQNKSTYVQLPQTACIPACNPGDIMRVRFATSTWGQGSDQGILGVSLGIKVHPTGDF